ncbi:hypothetical protein F441_10638 [Phytophthora nicotianae CJ01A1]|uniref:CCHC-type domain-containing protein n=1 Tax=Phytophthora nicotianae CJ01A1 TaxID=1317063 RepID=W2WV74_PHYNI|nr:hypothetical protein F441_10638 [Phytophthora nicotianae CJ01A1]
MDLAVKYEVTHFVDDSRERYTRQDKRKSSTDQAPSHDKSFKGKAFRVKGCFKPKTNPKRAEGRTCFHCKKPGHIKANCFLWKKEQEKQGNGQPPTTINVSRQWVKKHRLKTTKFNDKNIRVKLGDNQIVETELEVLPLEITVSGLDEAYKCIAVVYAILDEFDCILGIPFFEDTQPQIHWRGRRIEGTQVKTLHWKQTGKTCGPIEEGGPVIASGLRRSVETKGLSTKRPDSCRGAALETDVKSAVETVCDAKQKESRRVVCEQPGDASASKGSAVKDNLELSKRDGTVR